MSNDDKTHVEGLLFTPRIKLLMQNQYNVKNQEWNELDGTIEILGLCKFILWQCFAIFCIQVLKTTLSKTWPQQLK